MEKRVNTNIETKDYPFCLSCQFKQLAQKLKNTIMTLGANAFVDDRVFERIHPFKDTQLGYFLFAWHKHNDMLKVVLRHIEKGEYEIAAEIFNQYPKTISIKKRKR